MIKVHFLFLPLTLPHSLGKENKLVRCMFLLFVYVKKKNIDIPSEKSFPRRDSTREFEVYSENLDELRREKLDLLGILIYLNSLEKYFSTRNFLLSCLFSSRIFFHHFLCILCHVYHFLFFTKTRCPCYPPTSI